ncbi:MAG: hypothetical protein ACTHK4_13330 [Mycobacteriales bacterium]
MFLVAAGLALVAAAWIGVRGWRNRYDVLGRRRSLPVVSVVALVAVALALTVPTFLRHRLEGRLSKVASVLVGQPAHVHCETFGQSFTDLSGDLGFVKFDADGVPQRRTTIQRGPCADLRHYIDGDYLHPTANEIIAVHVLTHESKHMRGQPDEADAECEAMQRDAETAQLLGATPQEGLALARAYWIQDYPNMPDAYRSSDCRLGGALDEHLPDPPWTTGASEAVRLPPTG